MAEWISVRDRLPEENTPVLICTQWGMSGWRATTASAGWHKSCLVLRTGMSRPCAAVA